jgi:hypothetical protein
MRNIKGTEFIMYSSSIRTTIRTESLQQTIFQCIIIGWSKGFAHDGLSGNLF